MDKKTLKELKEMLEKEKTTIEEQLKAFAVKDKKLSGDWDTKFPKFNGESGGGILEKEAEELEEYEALLPIEYILETKLKNINSALEKIKEGGYGLCEKCNEKIQIDRLKVSPEAHFCLKCKNN